MDWGLYWFMFPVAICVATTAMLSGIGGAAMFTPIFLVVFPLLGPQYPFDSFAAAIGVSLITVTFGFLSGFAGYYGTRLIDFRSAGQFIAVGVPLAVCGALLLTSLRDYEGQLRASYAVLMLVLAAVLVRNAAPAAETRSPDPPGAEETAGPTGSPGRKRLVGRTGVVYEYPAPRQGIGAIATAAGGFLTGLLGVGIGEVVMPQLIKRNTVPIPVAAGTSVLVVIVVVVAASVTLVASMIKQDGFAAVPWNAVIYTVPGVIIGGQIGPRLQGVIAPRTMEWAMGVLFLAIGAAMGWIAIRDVLA